MLVVNKRQQYEFSNMISKRLGQYSSELGGNDHVSMVLRCYLSLIIPYSSGHVVDRRSDSPVESFVVHSPSVGQVGPSCEGSQALFLIMLR